jgi:hypothetical protein
MFLFCSSSPQSQSAAQLQLTGVTPGRLSRALLEAWAFQIPAPPWGRVASKPAALRQRDRRPLPPQHDRPDEEQARRIAIMENEGRPRADRQRPAKKQNTQS